MLVYNIYSMSINKMNNITKKRHNMLLYLEDIIYKLKPVNKNSCMCQKMDRLDKIYKIKSTLHEVYTKPHIKHIIDTAVILIKDKKRDVECYNNMFGECRYYCSSSDEIHKRIILWKHNLIKINDFYNYVIPTLSSNSRSYNLKINFMLFNLMFRHSNVDLMDYNHLYKKSLNFARDAKSAIKVINFLKTNHWNNKTDNDILFFDNFPKYNNLKKIHNLHVDSIYQFKPKNFKQLESMYVTTYRHVKYHGHALLCTERTKNILYLINNLPNLKYLRIRFAHYDCQDQQILLKNKQDIDKFMTDYSYYLNNTAFSSHVFIWDK